jgi:hypothetical protein
VDLLIGNVFRPGIDDIFEPMSKSVPPAPSPESIRARIPQMTDLRSPTPAPCQFSETDLAGIAHFANFFRWMEEAEHAYFRSVGLSVRTEYQDHGPRLAARLHHL